MLTRILTPQFRSTFLGLGVAVVLSLTHTAWTNTILPTIPELSEPLVKALRVVPSSLDANVASTITLTGDTNFKCNTSFTHDTATVYGNRIDLSFTMTQNPKALCKQTFIYPPLPIGPKFSLPKLSAGTYEVWVTEIPACAYSKPACLPPVYEKYAGVITVTDSVSGTIAYTINPTATVAEKDFSLDLLSYQFNCAKTYNMLSSSVVGNTISLTFLDHEPPAASICPTIYKPYGPTFKMQALKKGTYFVKAYRLPACAAQGCEMAAIPADAGILTVTDTLHAGWYLKDKKVAAEKPFALKLLNQDYGNCQTSFSHQSVRLESGTIWISFLIESHPERLCITDIHPNGPTFDMAALSAGAYPVQFTELHACEVAAPFCAVDRILSLAADTLIVSSSVGISSEKMKSNSISFSSNSFLAMNTKGTKRVQIVLPLETLAPNGLTANELWTAQLISLNGKILESHWVTRNKTEFESRRILSPGKYYIKLISIHGINHTIPLIQKN